jgi:hypothetical protein
MHGLELPFTTWRLLTVMAQSGGNGSHELVPLEEVVRQLTAGRRESSLQVTRYNVLYCKGGVTE